MRCPLLVLTPIIVAVLVTSFVASAAAVAGESSTEGAAGAAVSSGAKDLFFDPTGGAVSVQPPASRPAAQSANQPAVPADAPRSVQLASSPPAGAAGHLTEQQRGGRGPVPPAKAGRPAAVKSCGLHYWIELEEPGRYVSDRQVFHSGQRIRLHFVSNADGRILLLQLGASGTSTLLFPDPGKELTDNRLKAGEDRILPSDAHWFRFDANAGVERLMVLFARDAAELDSLPVKPRMGPVETKAVMQTASRMAGSKDLVIETETRTASEVGTYGVNLKGEPVILEIALQHR